MNSDATEIHSDDENQVTAAPPKLPPPPPRRTVQATLDLFVTAVPPETLSQSLEDSQPLQPGQKTMWTEKDVLQERKRLLLKAAEAEVAAKVPPPRPESTLPGIVSMLPRAVVNELLVSIVEKQELLTEEGLRDVLISVRSTNLGKLPDEILVNIFSYLPLRDKLTCILTVCTRFRPIIGEREIWRRVSLLKKDTTLANKVKWIKGPATVKLLTSLIPSNSIKVFTVHSDSLSKTQLIKCLKAHSVIKELNLIGSDFGNNFWRFEDFPVLKNIETLRVVTSQDEESRHEMSPVFSGWLQKLEQVKDLTLDYITGPTSMANSVIDQNVPEAPLHRTLVSLRLGSVHFSSVFDILRTCTALKHLCIHKITIYPEHHLRFTPNPLLTLADFTVASLTEIADYRLQQSKRTQNGIAKLVSLAIGVPQYRKTNAIRQTIPVAFLVAIGDAVGNTLEHLTVKNGGTSLRGSFPVLKTIRIAQSQEYYNSEKDPQAMALEDFDGLKAPKLAQLEFRACYKESAFYRNLETELNDNLYWEEVEKILGDKISYVKLGDGQGNWESPIVSL